MGVALLILLLGAAGVFLAARSYLRHEVEVPGKPILLGLRIAAILVAILLLLDVTIPGTDPTRAAPDGGSWVLVDGDLSLLVPSEGGGTLWEEALDRAREGVDRGARLALATPGDAGPEGVDLPVLLARVPDHPTGDLIEGIERLAEAGADSVIIVSSLRRPSGFLERLGRDTAVPLRLEALGMGGTRNAGVLELSLPSSAPAGEPIEGRVSVFAEGGAPGDSLRVEIRADGGLVTTLGLPAPGDGETAGADFALPVRPDTGLVRVTAQVSLSGDAFPVDDVRPEWIRVGDPVGGILLVSLTPDWEPRYLLPVLEAVTGLEGEGYLSLGEAGFLPLASGDSDLRLVGPERFQGRVANARLLVVHGSGTALPAWFAPAVREHPRVIHLPVDREGVALAGVTSGDPTEGEWAPAPEVPPSPVAPFLAGIPLGGLPPLSSLLGLGGTAGGQVALAGRALRGGESVPLLLLREGAGGRRAVALAQGFWRWGSREGEARQAYRSLWGGVASWLLDRGEGSVAEGVRPVSLVQARGVPLRWTVPTAAEGSELRLLSLEGTSATTATAPGEGSATAVLYRASLTPDAEGVASTPAVDPGIYGWEVRDAASGTPITSGVVEVESWAPSLRFPPLAIADGRIPASGAAAGTSDGEGRPLRTHPLPYLVALLLLFGEWLGRRRVGLR